MAFPPEPGETNRTNDQLADSLTARGLQRSFVDAFGIEHHASHPAIQAIARQQAHSPAPTPGSVPLVGSPDWGHHELVGELHCDNGEMWTLDGWMPPEVPYGYHRLTGPHAADRLVVAVPPTFPQPHRGWGFAVQLYAAHTEHSWGMGDFGDLSTIARQASSEGASTVLISPIHAVRPGPHQNASPYNPTSRLFLNLCHLDANHIPGSDTVDLSDLADVGRKLNEADLIDRNVVYQLKLDACRRVWDACDGRPGDEFEDWVAEQGPELRLFSVWSAIAENHLGAWWDWPAEYRRPDGPAVVGYGDEDRIRFWSYTQWVLDRQFAEAASQGVDIVSDIAIGFDAGGADGWLFQDTVAFGFEVGCPPDHGNPEGQRWGVVPLDPARLAASDYAPFVSTVRAALRHSQALRLDHVMGLWRLFWIPTSMDGSDGCYMRYHGEAMLGILRLEAHRAGAWVVGEDMGTLEPHALDVLAATGTMSYRVSTRTHPDTFPERAIVACQTHDQPTVAGITDGSDLATCLQIGKAVDIDSVAALRDRVAALAGIDLDTVDASAVEEAITAMYRELADSTGRVALITFDDLAGVSRRPNIPGIVDGWPNWRIPLPVTVDELFVQPLARRVIECMAGRRSPAAGR